MATMPAPLRRWWSPLRGLLALTTLVGIGLLALQPLGPPRTPGPAADGGESSDGFVPLSGFSGSGLPTATVAPELVGSGEPALTDLSGRPAELGEYAGRPVWIVFWATWCPPCRDEMPALSAAAEAYADAGLTMLAVNVEEPTGEVQAFVAELDLRMRVLTDPRGRSMRQWAVFGLPTHYLVAPDGSIAWRWFGPLEPDEIDRRAREAVAGWRANGSPNGAERHSSTRPHTSMIGSRDR